MKKNFGILNKLGLDKKGENEMKKNSETKKFMDIAEKAVKDLTNLGFEVKDMKIEDNSIPAGNDWLHGYKIAKLGNLRTITIIVKNNELEIPDNYVEATSYKDSKKNQRRFIWNGQINELQKKFYQLIELFRI